jgi:glucose/arabinose dehydrogenase
VEGTSTDKRYTNPVVTWPTAESSPSGDVIVGNTLIVAALKGQRLWVMDIDPKTRKVVGEPKALLQGRYGRLRTVVAAPDGSVWVATSNRDGRGTPTVDDDRILRIIPPGSSGVNVL